ncbi:MAG TPA: LuxR C-terminal-related transcriptional regulator [Gaiellaceae bacterium]|jgi:DNA-binding CsgD family transcriptional regulator|nr:LuxR C-terminal-related transcriptional regulator [Gaiellaceae bacterium]
MPPADTLGGDLEGALERVNVPSFILDQTGVVRWINLAARRLVGDVLGRHFTSVAAPEEKLRSQERFAQNVLGVTAVRDAEIVLMDAHRQRVVVEITSVPLRRGQRVIGVFGQAKEPPKRPPASPHPALTPRQAQVLGLLELGRSTKQIADDLHLSRETVRNHVRHLLSALGVKSRLEAVALSRMARLGG